MLFTCTNNNPNDTSLVYCDLSNAITEALSKLIADLSHQAPYSFKPSADGPIRGTALKLLENLIGLKLTYRIIGRNATEVIHIGQVAMTFGAKLDYFVDQVFNYPTFAEGYRIAVLNGLNKVRPGA